mmetsp:Transcript_55320/g.147690  ORF Transcript_55320/g.147690 Transcript_55320/m.147690 type:complete len:270 (-) Transcript_55320:27-836(-)
MEANYDTVDQICRLYTQTDKSVKTLDPLFFEDNQITDSLHKRLFFDWFQSGGSADVAAGVPAWRGGSESAPGPRSEASGAWQRSSSNAGARAQSWNHAQFQAEADQPTGSTTVGSSTCRTPSAASCPTALPESRDGWEARPAQACGEPRSVWEARPLRSSETRDWWEARPKHGSGDLRNQWETKHSWAAAEPRQSWEARSAQGSSEPRNQWEARRQQAEFPLPDVASHEPANQWNGGDRPWSSNSWSRWSGTAWNGGSGSTWNGTWNTP